MTLVDLENTSVRDPFMAMVLGVIGHGNSGAKKLAKGFYLVTHFSFEHVIGEHRVIQDWSGEESDWARRKQERADFKLPPDVYGVCDTPEQFMERYAAAFEAAPSKYIVSFNIQKKEHQSPDGGWRWHKWGTYIGDKQPQEEYLFDEGPEITQATCFHVYELKW